MATQIEFHVQGPKEVAVRVVSELADLVNARGDTLAMADPAKVAAGDGWIQVEFDAAEEEARAVLNSMLDQIPGSQEVLSERQPGDPGPEGK